MEVSVVIVLRLVSGERSRIYLRDRGLGRRYSPFMMLRPQKGRGTMERLLHTDTTHGTGLPPVLPDALFGSRHTHGREATQHNHFFERHTSVTIHTRLKGDFSLAKAFRLLPSILKQINKHIKHSRASTRHQQLHFQ